MARKKEVAAGMKPNSPLSVRTIEAVQKQLGNKILSFGGAHKPDPFRIPSGILPVDYATGGGIVPLWQTGCLWGAEKSGKTSLAGDTIKNAQNLCWRCFNHKELCSCSQGSLLLKCALGNVENTLDTLWYRNIGVDIDNLAIIEGESGEEFADIFKAILQADDLGLLVVDSLAALSPSAEIEASSEDAFYAKQAQLIGRMIRITTQQLIREKHREHPCAILYINQMRADLRAGPRGNPEKQSGGFQMKHAFSVLLRVSKMALTENDKRRYGIEKTTALTPVVRHAFSIITNKVLILANSGQFVRAKATLPQYNLKYGQVDDLPTVIEYAKRCGIISKKTKGQGWNYFDKSADTLSKIETVLRKKPVEKLRVNNQIIDCAKQAIVEGAEGNADQDVQRVPEETSGEPE